LITSPILTPKSIVVVTSKDGGKTLTFVARLDQALKLDQPSIAIGPSGKEGVPGSVWVSWENGIDDKIKVAGAPVTGLGAVGMFTGTSIADSARGNFGDIKVGPSGQVLVTYQSQPVPNPVEVGTPTGSAAATLTDTTKNWTVNQWVGRAVRIIDGPGD